MSPTTHRPFNFWYIAFVANYHLPLFGLQLTCSARHLAKYRRRNLAVLIARRDRVWLA
jgi:hypothetical protein